MGLGDLRGWGWGELDSSTASGIFKQRAGSSDFVAGSHVLGAAMAARSLDSQSHDANSGTGRN